MPDTVPVAFPLVRSRLLSQFPHIVFGMSTRQGAANGEPYGFNLGFHVGDDPARVEERLRRFLDALGLAPDEIAFMDQVHGDRIAIAEEPGEYPACDALATRVPHLGLAVRVADCVPVVLYAPGENLVAAIHAGWRGTAAHIAAKTVAQLCETYGLQASDFCAYIGPGAAACCYEVGADIAALFPAAVLRPLDNGGAMLDLHAANARQLADAGLHAENIDADPLCTVHNEALFHSHRRDGETAGRMLAVIAIQEETE
ncbi:MAG: peptidoglycan editing factor PgeF [Ignavibacteria bacterium]|nr:peptidoglycan editing factor PgeF [Ignavibacteria bacterium]